MHFSGILKVECFDNGGIKPSGLQRIQYEVITLLP
jgi:hypothetical protein